MGKVTPTQNVVISVDGSESTKGALKEVLKTMSPSTVLHLVQVCTPPGERKKRLFYNDSWSEDMERRYHLHFRAVLNDFEKIIKEHKITYIVIELFGDTKEQVCKYCEKIKADFLIIGFKTTHPVTQVIKLERNPSALMPCPILFVGIGNPKYQHIRSRSYAGMPTINPPLWS